MACKKEKGIKRGDCGDCIIGDTESWGRLYNALAQIAADSQFDGVIEKILKVMDCQGGAVCAKMVRTAAEALSE